jgi:hypothetical protein
MYLKDQHKMNIDIKNVDTNKELLYNTANLKMNKA